MRALILCIVFAMAGGHLAAKAIAIAAATAHQAEAYALH